jgi:hypothetical protein
MEAAMLNDYEAYNDNINLAIRDTEREIFSEAVNGYEDEDTNNQMVEDLSQPEAWDGGDLSMDEVAARTMHGDNPQNFDRPMQLENEQTLTAERDAARQERDAWAAAYNRDAVTPSGGDGTAATAAADGGQGL